MTIVLGIDTSTSVSVGVARVDDESAVGEVLADGTVGAANQHVEQLMPLVARVLSDAGVSLSDVGGIAVGLGPGPFTGLRVGIVTARVLASTLTIPLRGVCSLDVVAQTERPVNRLGEPLESGELVATIDARRKELYWARYEAALPVVRRTEGPLVTAPEALPQGIPVVGPGRGARPDLFGDGPHPGVCGGTLAAVAHLLADAGTTPLYLRRPDATEPTRRKSALAATLREPRR